MALYGNPYHRKPVIETPLSDALFMRMMQDVDHKLAALERAPTRRRMPLTRALAHLEAATSLARTLGRLLRHYEVIRQRPSKQQKKQRGEAARRELKRRLDAVFACEKEEEQERAAAAKT